MCVCVCCSQFSILGQMLTGWVCVHACMYTCCLACAAWHFACNFLDVYCSFLQGNTQSACWDFFLTHWNVLGWESLAGVNKSHPGWGCLCCGWGFLWPSCEFAAYCAQLKVCLLLCSDCTANFVRCFMLIGVCRFSVQSLNWLFTVQHPSLPGDIVSAASVQFPWELARFQNWRCWMRPARFCWSCAFFSMHSWECWILGALVTLCPCSHSHWMECQEGGWGVCTLMESNQRWRWRALSWSLTLSVLLSQCVGRHMYCTPCKWIIMVRGTRPSPCSLRKSGNTNRPWGHAEF